MTEITIRELQGIGEYREAVAFQESIWGEGFSERVPASLMKVTQRLGGVVAGAFTADGTMVGFLYGLTGIEQGRRVHWSDILAIRPGRRDAGLGRRMKSYQRDRVQALGVSLMRWTFDPLESRNAFLNLGRLGAVVREYVPDMYGASDSPLHRGLGTDRYVVSWELDTERVRNRLSGEAPPELGRMKGVPRAFPVTLREDGLPVPEEPEVDPLEAAGEAGGLLVPIPSEVQTLRDRDVGLAAEWRSATRRVLHPALESGWEVRDLVREVAHGPPVSYYLLSPASISAL